MKNRSMVAFAFVVLCASLAAEVPDQIKLSNGFVMRDCEILRWEKDSVMVKYVGGTVPIRFANMDPESQKIFQSESKEALRKQKLGDTLTAQSLANARAYAPRIEKKSDEQTAAQKEVAESKESAIKRGVTFHELVKGMTQDQVKQAYGYPTSTYDGTNSAVWTFAKRSKYVWADIDGSPKDVTLYFTGGLLTGWNNY